MVEAGQFDHGAFTERRVQVLALIESRGGAVDVAVEYFVPGAAWWPGYELHYDTTRAVEPLERTVRWERGEGLPWRPRDRH